MPNYRNIEPKDDAVIVHKFAQAYRLADKKKSWMSQFDESNLEEFMFNMLSEEYVYAHIVEDTFLVVYQPVCFWFSNKVYLEECLVLRLYNNPVSFECVVDFLEQMAREYECNGIIVSTDMCLNDERMSKKYQQYGFKEESVKLYKDVKDFKGV